MWFWLDFWSYNTSVVYFTGVLASFLAVGLTTFLTWGMKAPAPVARDPGISVDDSEGENEDEEDENAARNDETSPDCYIRHRKPPVEDSKNLTEDEVMREKMTEREQLRQIYELMKTEEEKFGKMSISEMEQQLRMYKT